MQISRRDFIHAGSAIAAASLMPDLAEASIHGSPVGNNNRVTINVLKASENLWANLAKGIIFNVPPGSADVNGYPTGTLAANVTSNPSFAPDYYGDYVCKWTGQGSIQFSAAAFLLRSASSAGIVSGISGTSGDTAGNPGMFNQGGTPRIVFTFGATVQGMSDSTVSNGSGGTYIKITFKTGYVNDFTGLNTLNQIVIQNSSLNGNIVGQTNAIGTWNYVQIDGTSIYLTTNVATGAVSAYNSGSPWVSGGESITPAVNLSVLLPAPGITYSSFANLVICKTGNETPISNGQIIESDYVNQLIYLMNHASAPMSRRGWLRFMDYDGVQGSYECDFANRRPTTYLSYVNNYFPQAYWTSTAIASSDGTAFTSNSGRAGAYQDLEIIQGQFSATNSSVLPTLNDNARGAVPVFSAGQQTYLQLSAPTASGQTLVITFSASWLNSGSAYAFSYTTVTGDVNNLSTFTFNLYTALIADTTLSAAKLNYTNQTSSGVVTIFPRTAQAGALTVTYTSGPSIVTVTRIPASSFPNGQNGTFVYNQIMGGFIWVGKDNGGIGFGLPSGAPLEGIVQLCNQVGAHCWFNWPVYTKGAFITSVTQFFGDGTTGLTSGLRFGTEVGNENWNFSLGCFAPCEIYGYAMNFSTGSGAADDTPLWSWAALRTMQYMALSQSAWTGKGRSASDHYILQMGSYPSAFPSQSFQSAGLQGNQLTTSNSIYSSYGGLGGGSGSDHSTSPNRPCDNITAAGHAMYWYDDYIGQVANGINGTTTNNQTWLQASLDYTNGLTSTAFTALVNQFIAQRAGTDTNSTANWTTAALHFTNFEGVVSTYDNSAGRSTNGVNPKMGIMHYEGAPQWSVSNSLTNGTNGTGSAWYTDLANQITSLGWNVSAYTKSGTNSATELANQVVNMIWGWKYDLNANGTAANTSSYKNMIKTDYYQALVNASAGKGREVKPAQYGYQDTTWGLFPLNYEFVNQYTNYDAIHEFNAGG